jgi:hypothetical protein
MTTLSNEPVLRNLPLAEIVLDANVQPRAKIDPRVVEEYVERIAADHTLPPVDVFDDGQQKFLAEGFHRAEAHRKLQHVEIACRVHQGSKQDAIWFAIKANQTHGLRRTTADKQRAVKMALRHPNGAGMSDSQIAEVVGVSHTMVAKYREELESTCKICKSEERTGRDGRKINTNKIGQGQRKAHEGRDGQAEDAGRTSPEPAETGCEKSVCSFCGFNEFDEDDDCVKCHEPRVWPRPEAKPERSAKAKAKPEPADEVVIEADETVADDDEPQSVRDCYVDPAEADFFCPEEPFDEDTVIQLEVLLESTERPLSLMLEHDAVAALSDHDPLKAGLIRLERAMTEVSAALERKRPISLGALQVA